ncbi:hypothetical protein V8C26DRAFT_400095 [Trichoderma gracile]
MRLSVAGLSEPKRHSIVIPMTTCGMLKSMTQGRAAQRRVNKASDAEDGGAALDAVCRPVFQVTRAVEGNKVHVVHTRRPSWGQRNTNVSSKQTRLLIKVGVESY